MPLRTQSAVVVQRHGNLLALHTLSKDGAETCPTVYMDFAVAAQVAEAMVKVTVDIQRCNFSDSVLKPVVIERKD